MFCNSRLSRRRARFRKKRREKRVVVCLITPGSPFAFHSLCCRFPKQKLQPKFQPQLSPLPDQGLSHSQSQYAMLSRHPKMKLLISLLSSQGQVESVRPRFVPWCRCVSLSSFLPVFPLVPIYSASIETQLEGISSFSFKSLVMCIVGRYYVHFEFHP